MVAVCIHVLHFFLFAVLHAQLCFLDQDFVLGLLQHDLGTQTHYEAVSRLKNFHEARVLLLTDHFYVRVHVVALESVNSGLLLLVLLRVNSSNPAFLFN